MSLVLKGLPCQGQLRAFNKQLDALGRNHCKRKTTSCRLLLVANNCKRAVGSCRQMLFATNCKRKRTSCRQVSAADRKRKRTLCGQLVCNRLQKQEDVVQIVWSGPKLICVYLQAIRERGCRVDSVLRMQKNDKEDLMQIAMSYMFLCMHMRKRSSRRQLCPLCPMRFILANDKKKYRERGHHVDCHFLCL